MPKSRNRPGRRRWRRNKHDALALDRMFDQVMEDVLRADPPPVLYHYTTLTALQGILTSQRFWATAHDCTNDEAELVSADQIITEVASQSVPRSKGLATEVLKLFLDGYSEQQVAKVMIVYLVCFSAARDDKEQWGKYADNGRGICLGLRLINEPPPKDPDMGSALLRVNYSESAWRESVRKSFEEICSLLRRGVISVGNLKLGLSALNRVAAFVAISAKRELWSVEQEFRHATILHPETKIKPYERKAGEKVIRYLPVRLRSEGKRLAFAEILTGPNQDTGEAQKRIERLLAEAGYATGDPEYPKIVPSCIDRWEIGESTSV